MVCYLCNGLCCRGVLFCSLSNCQRWQNQKQRCQADQRAIAGNAFDIVYCFDVLLSESGFGIMLLSSNQWFILLVCVYQYLDTKRTLVKLVVSDTGTWNEVKPNAKGNAAVV